MSVCVLPVYFGDRVRIRVRVSMFFYFVLYYVTTLDVACFII